MELDRRLRRRLRTQSVSFTLLLLAAIGLVAWLSTRYHYQADWTSARRHTLSEASSRLLDQLPGPIVITAYARDAEVSSLRQAITGLVARYQRRKPDLVLNYVDPDREPERARSAGVVADGELVVDYRGRSEHVRALDESALTNALQRLARSGERRIAFLVGHGERRIDGQANHDLGEWGRELTAKGLRIEPLNLTKEPNIAPEVSVVVVAEPQTALLPGEVDLIQEYVKRGGNLLWLADTARNASLEPLAQLLGLSFIPGVVVDSTGQQLGISQPDFVVVAEYPPHVITDGLGSLTLFPRPVGLADRSEEWRPDPVIVSGARSWSETGPIEGTIRFDEGADTRGPLVLLYALTRDRPGAAQGPQGQPPAEQRVVVSGDADFLSNSYLGNGGNLELGNRIINWLASDDQLIQIPPKAAPDTQVELSDGYRAVVGIGFLLLLPAGLAGAGLAIWVRRRKR